MGGLQPWRFLLAGRVAAAHAVLGLLLHFLSILLVIVFVMVFVVVVVIVVVILDAVAAAIDLSMPAAKDPVRRPMIEVLAVADLMSPWPRR